MIDYSQYSVEDFAADNSFRAWVLRNDPASAAFWKEWLAVNEHRLSLVEDARRLVLHLQFSTARPSADEMQEVWQLLDASLQTRPQSTGHQDQDAQAASSSKGRIRFIRWIAAAAAAILVSIAGISLLNNGRHSETTAYGATKRITLPDGSSVWLNANSRLSWSNAWQHSENREVWLEGEAYFAVNGKPDGSRATFTVHTKGMDVMVLGTTFNVYSRRDEVDVVLESGKVAAKPTTGTTTKTGPVTLRPGQLMAMEGGSCKLSDVDTHYFTGWKDDRLAFNNNTLGEIARVLEDNYGYEISWQKGQDSLLRFTGSCPATNINLLLSAIKTVNDVQIRQVGNRLVFE